MFVVLYTHGVPAVERCAYRFWGFVEVLYVQGNRDGISTRRFLFFFGNVYTHLWRLTFLEPVLFPFIKQICFWSTDIGYAWASISIFAHLCALFAVESIRSTVPAANNTSSLQRTIIAVVTNGDYGLWSHKGIADDTFPIAIVTQSTDCVPSHFSTQDEISMVCSHSLYRKHRFLSNCLCVVCGWRE